MSLKELRSQFRTPPEGYGLAPFWFWNDDLKPEVIRAQIAEMHAKNVNEFMIHGRKGLSVKYLSDEWFDRIGVALAEAKKYGMWVWIYDEDNWPSGYAGERVIAENPDYCGKCLKMYDRLDVAPPKAKLVAVVGDKRFYQEYVAWNPAYSESLYTDCLNRASTETFVRLTHDEYYNRFAQYFGGTIKGFFTDEPGFFANFITYPPRSDYDSITWTDEFPAYFRRAKGYDIIPHLPQLWDTNGGRDFKYRMDYYDVMAQMYCENFFKPMYDFCEAHGVKLIGHVNNEEYMHAHLRTEGDLMKVLSKMHYSGVDRIDYLTAPKQAEKYASSVEHIYGKERTLVELYALFGWGLNLKNIKRWANHQLVRGINKITPHAFYMSIEDDRKWECPPSLFLQNPYWRYFGQFTDYVQRMCFLLTRGSHVAPVCVYYPITTHQEVVEVSDVTRSEKLDRLMVEACEKLIENQLDFDFINDEAIDAAKIKDGGELELGSGCERYKAMLLVGLTNMPLETMRKVAAFAEAGGLVLHVYDALLKCADPARESDFQALFAKVTSSRNYRGFDRLTLNMRRYYGFGGFGVMGAIRGRKLEDVRLKKGDPAVKYLMRRHDGADIYFFINESEYAKTNTVLVRDTGDLFRVDPYTGEMTRAECACEDGKLAVPLEFTPWGEQVFIIAAAAPDKPAAAGAARARALGLTQTGSSQIFLRGEWDVVLNGFDGTEAGVPQKHELKDWAEWGMPTYTGFVTYTREFSHKSEAGVKYFLDLGVVHDCAEVTLNGKPVGEFVWEPYGAEITGLLADGVNRLEVRVCNTLGNTLMLNRTDINKNDYSYPSGLIGPVRIIAD